MFAKNFIVSGYLFFLIGISSATAQEEKKENGKKFDIAPVILDSKNGSGSALGLEYHLKGDLISKSYDLKDSGNDIKPDAPIGAIMFGYAAAGTVTASKERNPKNFIEFALDGKWKYSSGINGTFLGGLFAKYEANQSFDKKQGVFGLAGTYGKYSVLAENDFVSFDLNYGRVDPKDDVDRKSALGSAATQRYYRWNLELLYMIPVQSDVVRGLEFNYRYFKENDAPVQVSNVGLDRHQLATIRVGLKNDLFVAYSSGKLPFDKKKDQIFQVGFTYKFQ